MDERIVTPIVGATGASAGWRMVSVEPTPEMSRAAGWFDTPQMRRDYTALIDAAPSAKDKP